MTQTPTDKIDALEVSRNQGARMLAIGTCVMVPFSALAAFLADNSITSITGAAVLFACAALQGARMTNVSGRILVSFGLIGQAICITGALAGHAWQLDAHMLFFALLAACMIMSEPVVIISAAAVIAGHHIGLSLVMPTLVYPSPDLFTNLQRTALHGVIVVAEAAVLWSALRTRVKMHAAAVATNLTLMASEGDARKAVAIAEDEEDKVVEALRGACGKLTRGDLAQPTTTEFPLSYEELHLTYNTEIDGLERAMDLVSQNARTIATEVASIEQVADGLAKRTKSQAVTLEETSAAISQIAHNSKSAVTLAQNARAAVAAAKSKTDNSTSVVGSAISAMSEIEASSGQISKIVKVIEDLAFQTHLLTLNAGIEAARAGKAGRGFSVVASEVRDLARRSSEAAQEIGTLIGASGHQVASGVDLVKETGASLTEITEAVEDVVTQVAIISQSAEEQAVGISVTNDAVKHLKALTQQSAAVFEETNAVTQSLARQADQLAKAMNGFKLKGQKQTHFASHTDTGKTLQKSQAAPIAGNLALETSEFDEDRWE